MIQSMLGYGRSLARALIATSTGTSTSESQTFSTQLHKANQQHVHLLSAVAQLDKSTQKSNWSFGEDAYFLAHHRKASVIGEYHY